MINKRRSLLLATLAGITVIVAGAALLTPVLGPPGPRPNFQLPVACGETWELTTYPGHDDFDVDLYPAKGKAWGRPVHASFPGTVIEAGINGELGGRTPENPKGPQGRGGGYWVKIDHGGRWATLYLHMLEPPMVSKGDEVTQGQQLGKVGSTGNSSAPHLHFEEVAAGEKQETYFNGVPSGITSDDAEYDVKLKSENCP
ncbi:MULTISPECIES: M23 family metallopeptidase [Actinoplanes]|uniref:M23 family metallopeptidase n=1 Tax=Actinoplanes TaxID=1865 RepID=UPI001FE0B9B7|nr:MULTISPECIES: M23 family metallopeptidase [Actinoplanes]